LVLFDNAVKYSPAETTIRVEVKASNSEAEIVIEDEGVGVPEFELPHVFERYYRGGNAGAHHGEGVGLGLPVAKAIVEAHLGTIDLESMADRGTRVVVTLPLASYEHGLHDRTLLPAINVDPQ
jgi:signal transduction histidine kinase